MAQILISTSSRKRWQKRFFAHYSPGSPVNLEVDVIARYLERLLQGSAAAKPNAGIDYQTLADNGYLGAGA